MADDGPGIPPAERERIFERFAQAPTADSIERGTGDEHVGLGLAIARRIVRLHGGQLTLVAHDQPSPLNPAVYTGAAFAFSLSTAESARTGAGADT